MGTEAPDIDFGAEPVTPTCPTAALPVPVRGGLYLPILDVVVQNGPAPTDTQFDTVEILRQYDGFADFPRTTPALRPTSSAVISRSPSAPRLRTLAQYSPIAARNCAKVGSRSAGDHYAHAVAETSYAYCGDLSLAYQVFGDGPVELVYAGSFISHVELFWTMPEFEAFMEQLGAFCRVLLFDKAGVGLSDPVPQVRTLDDRAAEIEAVMDAVGFGKAVIFGLSEGGPAAMVFAATRPERTRALILDRHVRIHRLRRVGRHGPRSGRAAGARRTRAG